MKRTISSRLLRALAVITTVGLFVVNIVGFVDTETGSTFGCGTDWPLCNGYVIPHKWGIHTLIEFGHRAIVGVVTSLLVVLIVWALIRYRSQLKVKLYSAIAAGFVVVQAFLGALAAKFVNPPWVIALHFGFSLLAFAGLYLLMLEILRNTSPAGIASLEFEEVDGFSYSKFGGWSVLTFIYLYCAIYLGAFISSRGYGTSFHGWPFPTESPTVGVALWFDWFHRTVALGLVVLVFYLYWMTRKIRTKRRDLYHGAVYLFTFTVLQALSGAFVALSHADLENSPLNLTAFLVHVSIMTFLFTSLGYLLGELALLRKKRRANEQDPTQIRM